ncbi:biofilm regulation diguanylate cyclase SiaD [Bordetella genomosp. 13]|uniref:biofilm regulation diguanylate cyclase SiaD n=1 Tax=Bordetella genomosp. 13 TaxID=463040 RepID=UPI0011A3F094|nr:biofilm regulation diguanylate cyclase SiaD [Bordetella genomosp. 13]
MKHNTADLERRVSELLADPAHAGHPLHGALHDLWQHTSDVLERVERITQLSDAFQSMARERERDVCQRFDRQLRKLSRIVRISDHYQNMMRELNAALKNASIHDELTGLANRRALIEALKEETERACRHERRFVVVMLDVDHFKQINDRHGHDVGDRALIGVAGLLHDGMRQYDACGRWGGDEFLLLLPESSLEEAKFMLERLVSQVRELRVQCPSGEIGLTVSVGMAQYQPGETFNDTLTRADHALYSAKQLGRDRVAADGPGPLPVEPIASAAE